MHQLPLPLYRKACLLDVKPVGDFVVNCLEELQLDSVFPQDLQRIYKAIEENVEDGAVFLYEECGIIKGVLAVGIASFWWSNKEFLTNTVFYVDPDLRSKRVANRLLENALKFKDLVGLPFVFNFTDKTHNLGRKANYIKKKLGLKEMGISLM